MAYTLSAAMIGYRLQIAQRLGVDPARILKLAGIDDMSLSNPDQRLSGEQERAVWRAIVQETGREDIGLICGGKFPIQSASVIGYAMMNAPSLRVAGEKMQAYQRMVGESMGMRFQDEGRHTIIQVELWTDWYDELRYTMDLFMGAVFSWIQENSAAMVQPFRVGFNYQPPANIRDYEAFFAPAPVDFACPVSYLAYAREALDAPVLAANPNLFELFDRQAQEAYHRFENEHTFAFQVRKQIAEALKGEAPTIEAIASRLAVSVRKLQGLLQEEGASFQSLLNEVRSDMAKSLLQENRLSKSEIAYLLGFSDVSVFSRSFKQWTGKSPTEFQGGE